MWNAAIIINLIGVIIGFFSIYVVLQIYMTYKLKRTLWFFANAIGITIWNGIHLVFCILPENSSSFLIKLLWLVLMHSGLMFVITMIIGFHRLRFNESKSQLYVYIFLMGGFSAIFSTKEDWITYSYTDQDGFVTDTISSGFWLFFSIIVGIMVSLEILYPFFQSYRLNQQERKITFSMIAAGFLATFSNILAPIIVKFGLPQAIRFLIADIGFVIFFAILLKFPFTGLYDDTIIKQITVTTISGEPLLLLSDRPLEQGLNTVLTSGIFTSITAVLEELTLEEYEYSNEVTREFQLGENYFYIIGRKQIRVIFWYIKPTGVCLSKFRSLSRILSMEKYLDLEANQRFQEFVSLYFPDFVYFVQYYSRFS